MWISIIHVQDNKFSFKICMCFYEIITKFYMGLKKYSFITLYCDI